MVIKRKTVLVIYFIPAAFWDGKQIRHSFCIFSKALVKVEPHLQNSLYLSE